MKKQKEEITNQQESSGHFGSLFPTSSLAFRKSSIPLQEGQEHRSFNRPALLKRGEEMVTTMIILPLMYSHPSIKDTLPQGSVIASQSQLCLDNPSSKCTKRLRVPRTAGDCPTCCLDTAQSPLAAGIAASSQLSLISAAFPHFEIIFRPPLNADPQTNTHLRSAAV